jgi:excisionase family DNA binding protein
LRRRSLGGTFSRVAYAEASRQQGEVSPPEAAEMLGVHADTIRRWVHEGRLLARTDLCGRYWLQKHDLRALEFRLRLSQAQE